MSQLPRSILSKTCFPGVHSGATSREGINTYWKELFRKDWLWHSETFKVYKTQLCSMDLLVCYLPIAGIRIIYYWFPTTFGNWLNLYKKHTTRTCACVVHYGFRLVTQHTGLCLFKLSVSTHQFSQVILARPTMHAQSDLQFHQCSRNNITKSMKHLQKEEVLCFQSTHLEIKPVGSSLMIFGPPKLKGCFKVCGLRWNPFWITFLH